MSAAIAMVLVVGALDYATGTEASVSLLYIVPIGLATWFVGLRPGLLLCGLSAVVRLQDVWLTTHTVSHPLTSFWNGGVELGFFVLVSGILSRLRSTTEREATLIRTDQLTGALTRAAFIEIATREVARAERYHLSLSIAYFDVDDLKNVNAESGHAEGDRLLVQIAATLKRNLRSSDVLSRYSGDEFVLLLPETGDDAAKVVLDKLIEALRDSIKDRWPASLSIGAVTIEAPRTSLDRLIHQADALVAVAKQQGGDCVHHRHLHRSGTSEALPQDDVLERYHPDASRASSPSARQPDLGTKP
jgi:diguanylate cyclase (GGDEF)-like protein